MTFAGKSHGDLLIQPNAPVYAIIYENSIGQLTDEIAQEVSVFPCTIEKIFHFIH